MATFKFTFDTWQSVDSNVTHRYWNVGPVSTTFVTVPTNRYHQQPFVNHPFNRKDQLKARRIDKKCTSNRQLSPSISKQTRQAPTIQLASKSFEILKNAIPRTYARAQNAHYAHQRFRARFPIKIGARLPLAPRVGRERDLRVQCASNPQKLGSQPPTHHTRAENRESAQTGLREKPRGGPHRDAIVNNRSAATFTFSLSIHAQNPSTLQTAALVW